MTMLRLILSLELTGDMYTQGLYSDVVWRLYRTSEFSVDG